MVHGCWVVGWQADRSGDQSAVSELRRSTSEARLLAESHDAGVLRPLGPIQWWPGCGRAHQRTCAETCDSRRRSIPADAECVAALRTVADDSASTGDLA